MNPYHYGVVVGINRYPGVGDLSGPVLDAKAFQAWLTDPAGGQLPLENVETVVSPGPETRFADPYDARPLKREVDRALEKVNQKARDEIADDSERYAQSRLYLYVAGHGIMPRGGEAALLLADARRDAYEHVELSAYRNWYDRCAHFHEVVVFADTCRNWFPYIAASPVLFTECPRPGREVFTLSGYAAAPSHPAYEETEQEMKPDERRGYFTKALVDGLRSAPPDPAYGCLTSVTLARFVRLAVAEATGGKAVPQRVRMPGDNVQPIVFGTGPTKIDVTVHFPPGWTASVELEHSRQRTPYDPASGPWSLSLSAGLYQVVLAGTYDGSPFAGDGMFRAVGGSRDIHL